MGTIYKIINILNNKTYLGSSINVDKRIKRHKSDLKRGKHSNIYLQREYDIYKENSFIYQIIESNINETILFEIEQKYLDEIFSINDHFEYFYNIGKTSNGGDNISKHPDRNEIIEKFQKL